MFNHKLVIFLGDVFEYLSVLAKNYDDSAWLLTKNNYHRLDKELFDRDITVYTSVGDLPKDLNIVKNILSKADIIYYRPPNEWSDKKIVDIIDPCDSIQGVTETIMLMLPKTVQIDGFTAFSPLSYDPITLSDQRKTNEKQLWISGCSISHGVGVQPEERYGNLLAKTLNMECSFLTRPGSSIDWAADQILRSDIRKNDIVVWGITSWNRITYIHNHKLLHGVTAKTFDIFPEYNKFLKTFDLLSTQTFYKHFYAIEQVKNYCNKIGANLFLVGILLYPFSLLGFLKSQDNYIHIPYKLDSSLVQQFEDLGTDNSHPGPMQHNQYKDTILKHILQ
jgi:hypothetical protein